MTTSATVAVLPEGLVPATREVVAEWVSFLFASHDACDPLLYPEVRDLVDALDALRWLGAPGAPIPPGDKWLDRRESTHLCAIAGRVRAIQEDIAQDLRRAGDPDDRAHIEYADRLAAQAHAVLLAAA